MLGKAYSALIFQENSLCETRKHEPVSFISDKKTNVNICFQQIILIHSCKLNADVELQKSHFHVFCHRFLSWWRNIPFSYFEFVMPALSFNAVNYLYFPLSYPFFVKFFLLPQFKQCLCKLLYHNEAKRRKCIFQLWYADKQASAINNPTDDVQLVKL